MAHQQNGLGSGRGGLGVLPGGGSFPLGIFQELPQGALRGCGLQVGTAMEFRLPFPPVPAAVRGFQPPLPSPLLLAPGAKHVGVQG